jgi:hypothetical protein
MNTTSTGQEAPIALSWLNGREPGDLTEWDEFVMTCPRGHYALLSAWLGSYEAYGFSWALLVAREFPGGPICGGLGLIRAHSLWFKIVSVPVGPLVAPGFEGAAKDILVAGLEYARQQGAFLYDVGVPYSREHIIPATLAKVDLPDRPQPKSGLRLSILTSPNEMLWLQFSEEKDHQTWSQELLGSFKEHTRRDIRRAERNQLEVFEPRTPLEIREAYSLIERNGVEQGYPTRSWADFGSTLITQVQRQQAAVLVCRHQGRSLGAHYGVLAGKRYSYIMGGTVRTKPDLLAGHFLHWRALQKAKALNLLGYDFTSSGPPGVKQFKMGFRPLEVRFEPRQYYVLSQPLYSLFKHCYPVLRRHRKLFGSVLAMKRRLQGR